MTINDPRDSKEYQVSQDKYKPAFDRGSADIAPPQTVARFHNKSDVDSSSEAQHHTLGIKKDQASPGDHKHDGTTSRKILDGTTITGSRGGNAAVASIIAALVKLGATDSTTA
jgi:hypothetical protein